MARKKINVSEKISSRVITETNDWLISEAKSLKITKSACISLKLDMLREMQDLPTSAMQQHDATDTTPQLTTAFKLSLSSLPIFCVTSINVTWGAK